MLQRRLPLFLALFMVVAVGLTAVAIVLLNRTDRENCLNSASECDARVAELLPLANLSLAPQLLVDKACLACHNLANIAPPLELATALAASRRPPLSAATYLYESIVYPNAFVVEGYNPTMPLTELTDEELASLIAHLLGEAK
ncbi:MAG: hypothetical protein OXG02_01925 [Chloroflexi bacterium]|nr:hypothetical protein [Chloroflexota bacterium]